MTIILPSIKGIFLVQILGKSRSCLHYCIISINPQLILFTPHLLLSYLFIFFSFWVKTDSSSPSLHAMHSTTLKSLMLRIHSHHVVAFPPVVVTTITIPSFDLGICLEVNVFPPYRLRVAQFKPGGPCQGLVIESPFLTGVCVCVFE